MSDIQTKAVNLFMTLFSSKLAADLSHKNLLISDTLPHCQQSLTRQMDISPNMNIIKWSYNS